MLRQPAVLKITGVSVATIWRWEQAGLFPRRIRLGPNVVGWSQKEVDDWLAHKAAQRLGPATGVKLKRSRADAQRI
jgi:prophage regulatory protein